MNVHAKVQAFTDAEFFIVIGHFPLTRFRHVVLYHPMPEVSPKSQPDSPEVAKARALEAKERIEKIEKARREGSTELKWSYGFYFPTLPEELWQLTTLQKLYLYGNELTTLPELLGQLTALQTLALQNNQLKTLPKALRQLTALRELYLDNNKLATLPEELWELTALQTLNLQNNQITTLPESLGQLTALQTLNLQNNQLTTLPESLGELIGLQTLNLQNNQLTTLPETLGQLTALQTLNLHNNQLAQLPEALWQLTQLTHLFLHENPRLGLPAESLGPTWMDVYGSKKANPKPPKNILEYSLDLSSNQLTTLPESLSEFKALRRLDLQDNRLTTLPESLGQLASLQTLLLDHNELTKLPKSLGRLSALRTLALQNNRLTTLPQELGQLTQLTELFLHDNPGLGLPAEALGPTWADVYGRKKAKPKPPKEILEYYVRIHDRAASQPLNEFKLILVGRGGVGKTTLVERLVTGKFEKFERTLGIKITQWPMKIGRWETRAHVWDFGGQEIMHGTHRFFMTERALYVVLVSGREGAEDQDAEYWLLLIRSFAGDVPVLVLLHKWSEQKFELNRELLREKYGKNIAFMETDSETGMNIKALRKAIREDAERLPGLKTLWPKAWRNVKWDLPAAQKNWMTFAEFRTFCEARGVPKEEDQEALAASLHDLGLMLAYRKEEALRGFGVLHPTWVTDGIYQMLNAESLQERKGKFYLSDFAEVLPKGAYPVRLHPYLLVLMQKFRLCFPLDDEGKEYLIPELLSKREPELDEEFPAATSLCFTYQYETVLPEGLLPRFIVETNMLRETKYAWKTGVVLERGRCRALVRGDLRARRIMIRVTGNRAGRSELLGIVREHFERIHASFTTLPITQLVPVPGHPDVTVNYEELLVFDREGVSEIVKVIAGKIVKLIVRDMLNGVNVPGLEQDTIRERAAADVETLRKLDEVAPKPLAVFISYSHTESKFLKELLFNLKPFQRNSELVVWADPLVEAGLEWNEEIFKSLDVADIFILLLSPRSVASDFVVERELPRAETRRKEGKCEIIPIQIKPCRFDKMDLGKLQVIPIGRAITQHANRDVAWKTVTEELDRVIARIRMKKS